MFSAGVVGSVDAYLGSALSQHYPCESFPPAETRSSEHTAADACKPSYRLMPIALGLLISLEVCFKFVELWTTYELVLLSLGLSLLTVMS